MKNKQFRHLASTFCFSALSFIAIEAEAACTSDSQCKGGRVCLQTGACGYPVQVKCDVDADCPGDLICNEKNFCAPNDNIQSSADKLMTPLPDTLPSKSSSGAIPYPPTRQDLRGSMTSDNELSSSSEVYAADGLPKRKSYFDGTGIGVGLNNAGGLSTGLAYYKGPLSVGGNFGLQVMDLSLDDATSTTTIETRMMTIGAALGLRLKAHKRVHFGVFGALNYSFDYNNVSEVDSLLFGLSGGPKITFHPTDNLFFSIIPAQVTFISGSLSSPTFELGASGVRLDVLQTATIGYLFD